MIATTERTAEQIAELVLLRSHRRADEAAARLDPESLRRGIRRLACAVLRQAHIDAAGTYGEAKKNGYQAEATRFLRDSEEFVLWCQLAGLNPAKARERLLKASD